MKTSTTLPILFTVATILATACAMGRAPKHPRSFSPTPFASVDGGALITNDAGVTVDEGGVAAIPLATAITFPFDGGSCSSLRMPSFSGTFETCTLTTTPQCGQFARNVTTTLSPTLCAQLYAAAVAAAADGGIQ